VASWSWSVCKTENQGCQTWYIFIPKSPLWVFFGECLGMKNIGIFFGHLEYFVSGNPAENLGLRLRAKKERVHL
jgi:hypothetical protein